eukprot:748629-Hanusia_phi.AAC.1
MRSEGEGGMHDREEIGGHLSQKDVEGLVRVEVDGEELNLGPVDLILLNQLLLVPLHGNIRVQEQRRLRLRCIFLLLRLRLLLLPRLLLVFSGCRSAVAQRRRQQPRSFASLEGRTG